LPADVEATAAREFDAAEWTGAVVDCDFTCCADVTGIAAVADNLLWPDTALGAVSAIANRCPHLVHLARLPSALLETRYLSRQCVH
jgi:hypothetical protein